MVGPSDKKKRRSDWRWLVPVLLVAALGTLTLLRSGQMTVEEQFRSGYDAVKEGNLETARSIRQELTQRGAVREARVLQGGILVQQQSFAAALSLLDVSFAEGHLRRPVLHWVGQCLLDMGELGRAEFILRTVVAEFPDDSKAVRMLAVTYYDLGAMHPALSTLQQLKKLEPDDYRPFHLSGVIRLDFEQFPEAVDEFLKALLRNPPTVTANGIRQNLARAHVKLLQFEHALKCLAKVPESPERLALEAICHLALGDDQEAEHKIRRGKDLLGPDETEPDLLKAEARLLSFRRDDDSALTVLRKLVAIEPHNHETHHTISLTLGRLGRDSERDAALARAEQIRELRNQLTELSKQANESPHDVKVRVRLASTCEQLGLHELSRSWSQAAAAIRDASGWRESPEDAAGKTP